MMGASSKPDITGYIWSVDVHACKLEEKKKERKDQRSWTWCTWCQLEIQLCWCL